MDYSVNVTGFSEEGGHTVYTIVTKTPDDDTGSAKHRFNDFLELHSVLQSKLMELPAKFPVAKTVLKGDSVKRDRVNKLQEYLRNAMKAAGPHPPQVLCTFLKVPRPRSEPSPALPQSFFAEQPSQEKSAEPPSRVDAPKPDNALAAFGIPTDEELAAGMISSAPEPAPASAPQPVAKPSPKRKPPAPPREAPAPAAPSQTSIDSPFLHLSISRPQDVNEAVREAIKAGDTPMCLELLRSKADPNFRDRQGNYPLHMACMFGRTEVVEELLRLGADQDKQNSAGELPSRMASVSLRMKMQQFKERK